MFSYFFLKIIHDKIFWIDEANLNRLTEKLEMAEKQFKESNIDEELNNMRQARYQQVSFTFFFVCVKKKKPSGLSFFGLKKKKKKIEDKCTKN